MKAKKPFAKGVSYKEKWRDCYAMFGDVIIVDKSDVGFGTNRRSCKFNGMFNVVHLF